MINNKNVAVGRQRKRQKSVAESPTYRRRFWKGSTKHMWGTLNPVLRVSKDIIIATQAQKNRYPGGGRIRMFTVSKERDHLRKKRDRPRAATPPAI